MTLHLRKLTAVTAAALLALATVTPAGAGPSPSSRSGKPAVSPASGLVLNPEQLFVAIAPCRVFDTSTTTPLAANTTRNFYVSGTSYIRYQGGKNGGCGIPASATSVAITLTTSSSGGTGTLTGTPFGQAAQTAATAVAFNSSASSAAQVSLGISGNRITLKANDASTNVTGDVTGYYAPQIQAYVNADGSIYAGTSRIVSSTNTGTGSYSIIVDRDVLNCAAQATYGSSSAHLISATTNVGNSVLVYLYSVDSAGNNTLANGFFNITVHC